MSSKPLALGLLAVTCVVAAAGGAYIATRQNAAAGQPPAPPQATRLPDPVSLGPGVPAGAETVRPAAQPDTEAAASTPAVKPGRPEATLPPERRRVPAADDRQAAPPRPVETQPAVTQPDQRPARPGSDAPPNPGLNSGNAPAAPGAPLPPEVVAPPVESAPAGEPPQAPPSLRTFSELVVPADSVLGLQLETSLSSERARVEDRVDAKVARDVRVGDRVAIPAGSRVVGSVVQVGRGGKVKDRAYLSVKFHTIVLPDSTELAITTDAISRESESPASKSAAKIGGATVGGAILGAILGGGRGAAIGGTLGAASGTTAVMAGDRSTVVLPSGTLLTVRMLSPVTVTVEK